MVAFLSCVNFPSPWSGSALESKFQEGRYFASFTAIIPGQQKAGNSQSCDRHTLSHESVTGDFF